MLGSSPGCYIWHTKSLTLWPVDIPTLVPESPGVDLKIELLQFSTKCKWPVEGGVMKGKNDITLCGATFKTFRKYGIRTLWSRQTFIPLKCVTDYLLMY